MPSIFENYTERVNVQGTSLRKRYELDTESFIFDNFEDSPTFRMIDVYKKNAHIGEFPVRVNMIERMGNIRNIILPPHYDLNVGNMTRFEGRSWLIFDKYGYIEDHVRVISMRTNYNLVWMDPDNILQTYRCYASSSDIGSKSKQSRANIEYNKYDVRLPFGQLYVFLETTEDTEKIDLNHRFIVNKIVYEVIGIDNTTHVEDGYGIIQLTMKRTPENIHDDFELGIAHNNYLNSERNPSGDTGVVVPDESDEEKSERGGGMIW